MADEYMIRTVTDFAGIPEDKLLECLSDFLHFLELVRHSAKFDQEMQMAFELPEGSLNLDTDVFCWIDDGKRECSALSFVVRETGEEMGRMDLTSNVEFSGQAAASSPERPA